MFSASAQFYDLIYSTFKDYVAEAEQITSLLRRLNPSATRSLTLRVVPASTRDFSLPEASPWMA